MRSILSVGDRSNRTACAIAFCVAALVLSQINVCAAEGDASSANANDAAAQNRGAAPRIVLISLDGCTPRIVNQFLTSGVLGKTGIGLLKSKGIAAAQNITVTPSLTAVSHIAIATGSSAQNNDIPANSFELVASPITSTISGFSAPIGGYGYKLVGASRVLSRLAERPMDVGSRGCSCGTCAMNRSMMNIGADNRQLTAATTLTAQPLWVNLRAAGKKVVCATFPGGDGLDITVPGVTGGPIIQANPIRTVDYTIPFGVGSGPFEKGFVTSNLNFVAAPAATVTALQAAGKTFVGQVMQTTAPVQTFTAGGVTFKIMVAALNSAGQGYDTLVFFDQTIGIPPGPFTLPSTGPAYVKAGASAPFFYEGSSTKAGGAFFVSFIAPDLSVARFISHSGHALPRVSAVPSVIANVDDVNNNVGFWADQEDFFISERLDPSFAPFPDLELENATNDINSKFVDYQTRLALRAIQQNPGADLVMVYCEEPDGLEHQYLLVDPRQPTDVKNPNSIGANQDPAKVARYATYIQNAYKAADSLVAKIIQTVGVDGNGVPLSNVIVVSDHGFDPFHTAVSITNLLNPALTAAGLDPTQVRAVTSGPAVNVYINLSGREATGTLTPAQYAQYQTTIINTLSGLMETNTNYSPSATTVFDKVFSRPVLPASDPNFGINTAPFIGQDSGDVFAILKVGYNFDGTQSPAVNRLGDPVSGTPVLSLPNFYGAHGYDPNVLDMSAVLYAAGPDIGTGTLPLIHNIDIAPTIHSILGVPPAATVNGQAFALGSPTAAIGGSRPIVGKVGVAVAFDGSGSSETNGAIATYSWNFGDGSAADTSGAKPAHAYAAPGIYTVTLTVTDAKGQSAQITAPVIIAAIAAGSTALTDTDGDGFPDALESLLGSDPNNALSTPFGNQPLTKVTSLQLKKLMVGLNFKKPGPASDTITVSGTIAIPAGFKVLGQTVAVEIGGAVPTSLFTLDKNGHSKAGNGMFMLHVKSKRGAVEAQTAQFTCTFKGSFASVFNKVDGITSAKTTKQSVTLVVDIIFNQTFYEASQSALYTSTGSNGKVSSGK